MRRSIALLLLLLLAPAAARAEDADIGDALDGLSGEAALEFVKALAADEMKGRRTGFAGGKLAENWVIERFSEFGLHPADSGGAYLEPFLFGATSVTAPIVLKVGDAPLAYGKDFFELMQTGAGSAEAEVVFCGYGIDRPDLGWSDYDGVDVKGRIVMAIRGAPAARASEFREERFIGSKSATAAEKGAAGLLLVEGADAHGGVILQRFVRPAMPAVWISGAAADRILAKKGETLAALKEARDAGVPGASFATGVRATLKVEASWNPRTTGHNALGALPGRDPDLKDEVVLVGAHMDHLGVGPDGSVFNGADDNASGVGVLAHLVDILTANRWKPKRTVIFCAFGAEEQGLIGSRALAARYPFEGRVVCVLNLDMVGQGEPTVALSGGGSYPAMTRRLAGYLPDALASKTEFPRRTGEHGDHWPFYERGIPAYFVSTKGRHPNYHTPADDVANVSPVCLEAAARAVGHLVVRLGNCMEPLASSEALPGMLLREGPRAGVAVERDGKLMIDTGAGWTALPPAGELAAAGVSALVVRVPESAGPQTVWDRLVALETSSERAYRVVRRAADLGAAHAEGAVAILPVLACQESVAADIGAVDAHAQSGYRILAPWVGEIPGKLTPVTAGDALAMLDACRRARVLPCVDGIDPASFPDVRKGFGDAAAVHLVSGKSVLEQRDALRHLGHQTLLVLGGGTEDGLAAGLSPPSEIPPCVVVSADTETLTGLLRRWAKDQPVGWALPESPDRRTLRAALGGRLAEWLRRAGP